jgi:DNA-directed RNA polymerase specialized sigma24 family protein
LVRGRPQFSLESGWRVPQTLDFAPWKEFQKKAPEEELLALVWSKALNFTDEEISQGLGLTEGTLRFRVGRALRKMGTFCRAGDKIFKVVRPHE